MIKAKVALLAEQIILDRDTGSPTAVNILAGLLAHNFPFVMPRLACIFILEREMTDPPIVQLTFRLLALDKEILKTPVSVNFLENPLSTSYFILNGVIVPSPGKVSFEIIKEDGVVLTGYSFDVIPPIKPTIKEPAPQQAAADVALAV